MSEILKKAKAAKKVSFQLIRKTTEEKNEALASIANSYF